ncbi:ThuA domain-containing protein [Kitasatospora sp. NPDC098652]|uniref:ThuA domain-containing protein n=1 Tax=Kitasatospora sp. NPDC098652 TaxID=3364095 RepID=UPI0038052803
MQRSRLKRGLAALGAAVLGAALLQIPAAHAAEPAFKVLLFTKTADGSFRHDSIDAGVKMFQQLGADNGFQVDRSEDATVFNSATLSTYSAVVMFQTSGMVWDTDDERKAVQDYVHSGHGIVAVHNATDMRIQGQFPWWDQVLMGGAHMTEHSAGVLNGTAKVADKVHPSTQGLPDRWTRAEEWYNFDKDQRGDVHVLVTADETTYDAGPKKMGPDHPISWCRNAEGGKVWATAMGHESSAYSEPLFKQHLLGGIKWAAGSAAGDCSGTVTKSFQKVTLDGRPTQPMALDVAPDGKVFYVSRSGELNVIHTHDGVPETHLAGKLDVYDGGEAGLVGVALDPGFATNRWIYLYYAPKSPQVNRLSRFTVNADDTLDKASEKQLLNIPVGRDSEPGHTGGYLTFGPGGNLYIGTGDDTNPFESDLYTPIDERPGRQRFDAQGSAANTNDLRGKILRIHPESNGSYTVPSGNLFAPGTAKTKPEIYVMGMRNSFRFSVDKETGWISAGDYGPDASVPDANRGPEGHVTWDLIKEPGNYGWPYCVANKIPYNKYDFATHTSGAKFDCDKPVNHSPNNTGLTDLPPTKAATVWYTYDPSTKFPEIDHGQGAAPMGGPFYHYDPDNPSDRKFPEYYDKTPFFYEWSRNFVKEFKLDSNGELLKINPFPADLKPRGPIDMKFGPDGAMYLAEWGNGFGRTNKDAGIYRIDYVSGKQAPLAKASATPDSGQPPLDVAFSSAGSVDPNGEALTYLWDFGDGSTSTDANPTHTYTDKGTFKARLTVTNASGKSAAITVPVAVGVVRPTVRFTSPPDGGFFGWGDSVSYTVEVTDPDGGPVDCAKVKVSPALGHDHTHTHETGQFTGCSGTFTTNSSGHGEFADIYMVLTADYISPNGLTGTTSIMLQPKRKQAPHYTSHSGTEIVASAGAEGGRVLGTIRNGDWISFDEMNLAGIDTVSARVSSPADGGGTIEIHADAPDGTLVSTIAVPATGGWETFAATAPVKVADPGGTHTLYAVFGVTGGSFNVNSFTFGGKGVSVTTGPQPGGRYVVTNAGSGKALEVQAASTADGAAVVQNPNTGAASQQWTLNGGANGPFTMKAQNSGKCLDLTADQVGVDGAKLWQWGCWGGVNQQWRVESVGSDTFRIVSAASGKCLDVPENSGTNGLQLNQYACNGTPAQQWKLSKVN